MLFRETWKKKITWGEDIDKPELSECIVQKRHGFSIGVQNGLAVLSEDLLTISESVDNRADCT